VLYGQRTQVPEPLPEPLAPMLAQAPQPMPQPLPQAQPAAQQPGPMPMLALAQQPVDARGLGPVRSTGTAAVDRLIAQA
jgi:hypothetical protein